MPPAQEPVSKPAYLTDEQWSGLTLAILVGVAEGTDRAGLPSATGAGVPWASDLGVAAVEAVRRRLDELWAQECVPDG